MRNKRRSRIFGSHPKEEDIDEENENESKKNASSFS